MRVDRFPPAAFPPGRAPQSRHRRKPPTRFRPRILGGIKALLLAGGLASVAVVVLWDTGRPPRLAPEPAHPAAAPGHAMSGARLVGTDREGRRYHITAEEIFEEAGRADAVRLNRIQARFLSGTKKVSLTAAAGRYDIPNRRVSVFGGMRMETQDGTVLETESSAYFPDQGVLEGTEPVHAAGTWGVVDARGYRYDLVSGTLSFTGRPQLMLKPGGRT